LPGLCAPSTEAGMKAGARNAAAGAAIDDFKKSLLGTLPFRILLTFRLLLCADSA
jgi:hypothetical protein